MNKKLKALRLESGLTQKELAKKINSTDKNIWAYENAVAIPPAEVIIAYAKFFNVTSDYLLGLEDDFGARTATPATAPSPRSELSADERCIIEQYRNLPEQLRELVRQQLNVYSSPEELLPKNNKKV